MMGASILIVDDEKTVRTALRMTLEGEYSVTTAGQGSEALKLFHEERPDLILLDIGLPDMNGIDVLKSMKDKDPDAMVVMVTAVDEVKTIVEAVKLGAFDYLVKPIDAQELVLTVQNALENKQLKNQIQVIQEPSVERYKFDLIGDSAEAKQMIEIAKKISKSVDTPVLIVGESGSGKSVLARAIHYSNKEAPGPFITVNCGAIPAELVESELFGYERGAFTGANAEGKKGRLEQAAGGTLLLDEIGAMALLAQAKLLGVLEDRTFQRVGGTKTILLSSRIIVATNSDLESAVEQGLFRMDLFYRLNVVKIEVPPLRKRRDDIIPFAEQFMAHYNQKFGKHFSKVSPEAREFLLRHRWTGNVRELRNTIERIILLEEGTTLLPEYLPSISNLEEQNPGLKLDLSTGGIDYEEVTKSLVEEALKRTQGNVLEAARLLNMPAHKLRYRIKKFGLRN